MTRRLIIEHFLTHGFSMHTPSCLEKDVVTDFCRKNRLPFWVEAGKESGKIVDYRVVLAGAHVKRRCLSPGVEVDVIEEWGI